MGARAGGGSPHIMCNYQIGIPALNAASPKIDFWNWGVFTEWIELLLKHVSRSYVCGQFITLCLNYLSHSKIVFKQLKACNKLAHLEIEHVCCRSHLWTSYYSCWWFSSSHSQLWSMIQDMHFARKLSGRRIPSLVSLSLLATAAAVHVGNGPRYSYTFLPFVFLFICATNLPPLVRKIPFRTICPSCKRRLRTGATTGWWLVMLCLRWDSLSCSIASVKYRCFSIHPMSPLYPLANTVNAFWLRLDVSKIMSHAPTTRRCWNGTALLLSSIVLIWALSSWVNIDFDAALRTPSRAALIS